MTILTLKGIPICGAARPTPGANLITFTISSIIFWIRSDPISSGRTAWAGSWRTGSPAFTISGSASIFSRLPRNQPARAAEPELRFLLGATVTGRVRIGVREMALKWEWLKGRMRWVNLWMVSIAKFEALLIHVLYIYKEMILGSTKKIWNWASKLKYAPTVK